VIAKLTYDLFQVDKLEQMLGSYGPSPDGKPYTKNFDPEESPSGMLARSGTYHVRSRVVDDDGEVYAGTCLLIRRNILSFLLCHATNVEIFFPSQIGNGASSWPRSGKCIAGK